MVMCGRYLYSDDGSRKTATTDLLHVLKFTHKQTEMETDDVTVVLLSSLLCSNLGSSRQTFFSSSLDTLTEEMHLVLLVQPF